MKIGDVVEFDDPSNLFFGEVGFVIEDTDSALRVRLEDQSEHWVFRSEVSTIPYTCERGSWPKKESNFLAPVKTRACPDCGATEAQRHKDDCPKTKRYEAEKKSAGLKFDTGKPPFDLLSRQWLEGTAQVLAFGAKKYDRHNWRKGIQFSRLLGAALRHLLAFQDGEDLDPETGLSHIHHASCCLMFLSELQIKKPEMDDRYKS